MHDAKGHRGTRFFLFRSRRPFQYTGFEVCLRSFDIQYPIRMAWLPAQLDRVLPM